MKYLLLVFSLILFLGCKKAKKEIVFYMDYDASVTVPASTSLGLPINLPTPDVTTNSESNFEQNKTTPSLVQSITISTLTLKINSPSAGNFNFLKSISIYISTSDLPEIKVAWKEPVPNSNSTELSLDLSAAELLDYLKSEQIKMRVTTITDELIASDYQIAVHSLYRVSAKLLRK